MSRAPRPPSRKSGGVPSPRAEETPAPTSRRADARRNRDKVLEVARRLFAEQGLSVGIDAIAERAGVGVGTVYRHFPTKEALFQATLLSHVEEVTELARASAEAADPGAAFFAFLRALVARGSAKRDLAEALGRDGTDLRTSAPALSRGFRRAASALLARAQQAGAVRKDVELEELIALLSGIFTAAHRAGADQASRDRLFEVVTAGLRPASKDR